MNTQDDTKGCPICGSKLAEIRGRYPGDAKRLVCPTCLQERMEWIRDVCNPTYGIACQEPTSQPSDGYHGRPAEADF
jgi:hypothetical protein